MGYRIHSKGGAKLLCVYRAVGPLVLIAPAADPFIRLRYLDWLSDTEANRFIKQHGIILISGCFLPMALPTALVLRSMMLKPDTLRDWGLPRVPRPVNIIDGCAITKYASIQECASAVGLQRKHVRQHVLTGLPDQQNRLYV